MDKCANTGHPFSYMCYNGTSVEITEDYWRLLEITEDYWKLLEITEDYWKLLEITVENTGD